MEEFEEIYLSGGQFTLTKEPEGGVSVEYSAYNRCPMAMFRVCVSLDGNVLGVVPFGGIGQVVPYPQPSLMAFVLSDRHGMFGRQCPDCQSYFRTSTCPEDSYCPYCGHSAQSIAFLTDNQLRFIAAFCDSFRQAQRGHSPVVMDIERLGREMPENRPQWAYSEERQQSSHVCAGCSGKYDILGDYGLCPQCARLNLADVFIAKMEALENQFRDAEKHLTDRHERDVEWENLTRCVSEFESVANHLRAYMLRLPATPARRKAIRSLSFQRILYANDCMREWYGFEVLPGVSEADRTFLNTMFNRRHVFVHRGGRVDQQYLDKTGDTSVRLNQLLRVRSGQIRRLIPLVRSCGITLVRGYESIQ